MTVCALYVGTWFNVKKKEYKDVGESVDMEVVEVEVSEFEKRGADSLCVCESRDVCTWK